MEPHAKAGWSHRVTVSDKDKLEMGSSKMLKMAFRGDECPDRKLASSKMQKMASKRDKCSDGKQQITSNEWSTTLYLPNQWFATELLASPLTSMVDANEAAYTGEGRKILYIFYHHFTCSIGSSLYAIDLGNYLPSSSRASPTTGMFEPPQLNPILEFPDSDFARCMRCVELDSKLYFIGGTREEFSQVKGLEGYSTSEFTAEVHMFDTTDTASIIASTAYTTSIPNASDYVRKVKSMKCAKFSEVLAFAAFKKIYVMAQLHREFLAGKYIPFEAFDPMDNDWTALPSPPFCGRFTGHVVIGTSILFVTNTENCYMCFDAENKQWTCCWESVDVIYNLDPVFVEDTLYAGDNRKLWAYDRVHPSADNKEGQKIFKHEKLFFSPDVMDVIGQLPRLLECSWYLVHLGERRFCYITVDIAPEPNLYRKGAALCHPYKKFLNILMFQDLRETYTSENGDTCLKWNLLCSKQFFIRTRWSPGGVISDCFSVCSEWHPDKSEGDSAETIEPYIGQ